MRDWVLEKYKTMYLIGFVNKNTVFYFYIIFHIQMQTNSIPQSSMVDFSLFLITTKHERTFQLNEKYFIL